MKPSERWDSLIQYYAEKYAIPFPWLRAQVMKESSGNPKIVNAVTGAAGLMQLMKDTAKWLGVKDRLDPEDNLAGGARYMRTLEDSLRLRFQERGWHPVSNEDFHRMALTGYLGGQAYVYQALKQLGDRQGPMDWPYLLAELRSAYVVSRVTGKRKRIDTDAVREYVDAILPWGGGGTT